MIERKDKSRIYQRGNARFDEQVKVGKRTAMASSDCTIQPSLAADRGELFSDFVDLFTNAILIRAHFA